MAFRVTRASKILHIGDSVTGPTAGSVSPFYTAYPIVRAMFGSANCPPLSAPFWPPIYKWPTNGGVSGVAGRECKTIGSSAPTFATFAGGYTGPFTHAVIQLGINDAAAITAATTTVPVMNAAQLVIVDGLNSIFGIPYVNMLWIGPWSNAGFAVATVDTNMAANSQLRGFNYCTWSEFSSANPAFSIDGVHPNAAGAAILGAKVASVVAAA